MSTTRNNAVQFQNRLLPIHRSSAPLTVVAPLLFAAASLAPIPLAQAQTSSDLARPPDQPLIAAANTNLPDAPDANFQAAATDHDATVAIPANSPSESSQPEALPTERYPRPGQPAPILTPIQKFDMGIRDSFTPFAAVGWISAAGWEQLTNTAPNWGTDRGAFGRRLGDAPIRASSEGILSDSVLAPLLHQDPRYYRLGSGHKPLARVLYAATRPIITRTDHGRTVPNFALMGGNLAGATLTNLYYPHSNHGLTDTLAIFGSSLAGSAIGDGFAEFFGGILFDHHFHRSK